MLSTSRRRASTGPKRPALSSVRRVQKNALLALPQRTSREDNAANIFAPVHDTLSTKIVLRTRKVSSYAMHVAQLQPSRLLASYTGWQTDPRRARVAWHRGSAIAVSSVQPAIPMACTGGAQVDVGVTPCGCASGHVCSTSTSGHPRSLSGEESFERRIRRSRSGGSSS